MITDYIVRKKDNKELARDKIISKVFDKAGYNDMYRYGCISTVESLLNCFSKDSDTITKDDLFEYLKIFKKETTPSQEVIDYINTLLKEESK